MLRRHVEPRPPVGGRLAERRAVRAALFHPVSEHLAQAGELPRVHRALRDENAVAPECIDLFFRNHARRPGGVPPVTGKRPGDSAGIEVPLPPRLSWNPACAGMTGMAFGAAPCGPVIPAFAGMTPPRPVPALPRPLAPAKAGGTCPSDAATDILSRSSLGTQGYRCDPGMSPHNVHAPRGPRLLTAEPAAGKSAARSRRWIVLGPLARIRPRRPPTAGCAAGASARCAGSSASARGLGGAGTARRSRP